ncbi:predicted protein [Botrytis cinerea T4]|uniref:Uncharacterized protein n=1 Tax=Botryotinia fuckeliana (strain T4) TaxID=999810 RepID=G2XQ83_BOTF4|nr:predicted protein [Botrytis cinerea T4]
MQSLHIDIYFLYILLFAEKKKKKKKKHKHGYNLFPVRVLCGNEFLLALWI